MSIIRNAGLRALCHPLCLFGIGLLILNDHFLKPAYPGVLTGKISDFAGLFFFPFFLIVIASFLPLGKQSSRTEWFPDICFAIAAVWFAAIKTLPAANGITIALLNFILGGSFQIVMDSTDLIALCALAPAWILWMRIRESARKQPRWRAVLGFSVASVAVMATSPAQPPPVVERVAFTDEFIYYKEVRSGGTAEYYYESTARFAHSYPDIYWAKIDDPPEEVYQQLNRAVEYPLTVCNPANSNECYRTTGEGRIEFSSDGGLTWIFIWDRSQFITDDSPYDLAIGTVENGSILAAAMGLQGVLIRTPDGVWRAYQGSSRGSPETQPYGADDLSAIVEATITEITILATITLMIITALFVCRNLYCVRVLKVSDKNTIERFFDRLLRVLVVFPVFLLGMLFFRMMFFSASGYLGLTNEFAAGFLGFLTLLFVLACRLSRPGEEELPASTQSSGQIEWYWISLFLFTTLLFFLSWLPFALWARGSIMFHATAVTVSVIVFTFFLFLIIRFHAFTFCGLFRRHGQASKDSTQAEKESISKTAR